MKFKLFILASIFLASCSSNSYYLYLDGKDLDKNGFKEYTPSVTIGEYSNTFSSAVGRFVTLNIEDEKSKLDFRLVQPKEDNINNKLIIMMPGHQGVWLSLMPTANLLLNKGYHIIFIDYYGEKNGLRAENEKDWGEKEVDELVFLVENVNKIESFKDYKIGYFGTSLGTLVGLSAMTKTNKMSCFVGEGMPVNPRRSAENILDETFWMDLFIDLDDYNNLITSYNPESNLKTIEKSKALYFFWGDDDKYYFEEDWLPLEEYLINNFPKSKSIIFENAKHTNRLGSDITPEKFEEINNSILEFFNENL
jgi:dienelactone hydrolase